MIKWMKRANEISIIVAFPLDLPYLVYDSTGPLGLHREELHGDTRFAEKWRLCTLTNGSGVTGPLAEGIRDADVLIAVIGLVVLIAVALWLRRRQKDVAFLTLLVPVAVLPYFFLLTVDLLIEYKFYLSMVGVCGVAGIGLARLARQYPTAGTLTLGGLVFVCSCFVWVRNPVWRTDLTLYRDAYEKAPRHARAINSYAWALATDERHRNLDEALKLARLSMTPGRVDEFPFYNPHMHNVLAEVHYLRGEYARAVAIGEFIIDNAGEGHHGYFRDQLDKFKRALETGSPAH
jgi:hypothetical protein